MQRVNPQVNAIALLVRKFGEKIAGGGYEVRVTFEEMIEIGGPQAVFQEVPDMDSRSVRWQFFPNPVIDLPPDSVRPVEDGTCEKKTAELPDAPVGESDRKTDET